MRRFLIFLPFALILTYAFQHVVSAPVPSSGGVFPVESVTKKPEGLASDFTWKQNGKITSFSEYTRGKVVILNFWATWCGPCRKEMPDLVDVSKEYASKGVAVVGISVDQADNAASLVQSFVDKLSIPYPTIIDNMKIAEAYGHIPSIPTTFIIDKSGKIVQKIVGMQSKIQFETAIQRVLNS